MEFYKDGKTIRLSSVSKVRVGQALVLGCEKSGDVWKPYPLPSLFVVEEAHTDGESWTSNHYVLRDERGQTLEVGHDLSYLYDVGEWVRWHDDRERTHLARADRKITKLEGDLELLKGILERQGCRIVTEAQAKELGLK